MLMEWSSAVISPTSVCPSEVPAAHGAITQGEQLGGKVLVPSVSPWPTLGAEAQQSFPCSLSGSDKSWG